MLGSGCPESNNEKAMLKGPVKIWYWLGVLVRACIPSMQEAEGGGLP